MIDCHTHILPGIDDGSRSSAESAEMLRAERAQGISTVILTPHFYADEETVGGFLERRDICLEHLHGRLETLRAEGESFPELMIGAEVRYFANMSRSEDIDKLCIKGTRYMMIEMPFDTWSDGVFRDLDILRSSGIIPVIAHVERYMRFQKHTDNMERLWESEFLIQSNASFFTERFARRTALGLLKNGRIDLLGSDSHRAEGLRTPDMADALAVIEKKLGRAAIERIEENGHMLLVHRQINS